MVVAKTVIAGFERENIDWVGSAYCCYAFCLKETGQYQDALSAAEKGKQRGFNLNGAWYYHDANVSSRNFLDDLPGALMSDFHRFANLTDAVANIKRDALMRG